MSKEYFQTNENNDFELLVNFNNSINKAFDLTRLEEYAAIDASGVTATGVEYNFELKRRNQELIIDDNGNIKIKGINKLGKPYYTSSIMIESHKVCSLAMEYFYFRKQPVYVNFIKNAVIIFNLNNLKKRLPPRKMKIKSDGYEGFEISLREFLHIDDAVIYVKDNNSNYKLYKR